MLEKVWWKGQVAEAQKRKSGQDGKPPPPKKQKKDPIVKTEDDDDESDDDHHGGGGGNEEQAKINAANAEAEKTPQRVIAPSLCP